MGVCTYLLVLRYGENNLNYPPLSLVRTGACDVQSQRKTEVEGKILKNLKNPGGGEFIYLDIYNLLSPQWAPKVAFPSPILSSGSVR